MKEPIKVKILEELVTALKEITPDSGYYCDLSGDDKVMVGVTTVSTNDVLPVVSIMESEEEFSSIIAAPQDIAVNIYDWELLLTIFVNTDYEDQLKPQRTAYRLLNDIKKRLFLEQKKVNQINHQKNPFGLGYSPNTPDQIVKFSFNQGVVRPPDNISEHIFSFLRVTFTIKESIEI